MADPSVITIDNISSRMPPHNADSAEKSTDHLYALVDMGSNGIRFSISDLSPPTARLLPCIYRDRAPISLYDALHSSLPGSREFIFDSDTIAQVAKRLAAFKYTCDSYGVLSRNIGVFATEAMRTALNRKEMTDAIKRESGLEVDILSPQVESLLGAMGARSGFVGVRGLMMDLGGGSVQMTFMDSGASVSSASSVEVLEASTGVETYWGKSAAFAKSMPFGAAKMTAMLGKGDIHDIRSDMRTRFQETFQGLCGSFSKLQEQEETEGVTIYLCGGGFRGYGSMLMHTDPINPYPIPSVAGYKVSGKRFKQTKEMLRVNEVEKEKIHGMSKRRREQFPAIVEVVEGIISVVPNIKEVIFCGGGNREGVLFLKLPSQIQETHPLLLLPSNHSHSMTDTQVTELIEILSSSLPAFQPGTKIFNREILSYIVKHMWENMADISNLNAARALHTPISGPMAGKPGLSHEVIAILSLTMCARWENDVGKVDRGLFGGLRGIVGEEGAWWCDYLGAVARGVCELVIVPGSGSGSGREVGGGEKGVGFGFRFNGEWTDGLGKKGKKEGVKLRVLGDLGAREKDVDLEKVIGKVGKGLGLKRRVEVEKEG